MKISILYDSIFFSSTKKKYFIYKRKLCAFIKFVIKYDYFCKHFRNRTIIHIDHKSLIRFLRTNFHENIYEHWIDKFRKLNLKITYISKRRNRIADELFKTIFLNENCIIDRYVKRVSNIFQKKKTKWIWKNEKKNYQKFLNHFQSNQMIEMTDRDTFEKKNVFQIFSMKIDSFVSNQSVIDQNQNSSIISWNIAYRKFDWFEITYRILIDMNSKCFLNV